MGGFPHTLRELNFRRVFCFIGLGLVGVLYLGGPGDSHLFTVFRLAALSPTYLPVRLTCSQPNGDRY